MTEIQGSPNSPEVVELRGVLSELDKYDFGSFSSLVKKVQPSFIAGNVIHPKEFDENGINKEIVEQIDKQLEKSSVVLLIGAYRMGTSSVGQKWVSEKPKKRGEVSIQGVTEKEELEKELSYYSGKDLFIDEVGIEKAVVEVLNKLVKSGRKLVLRSHLDCVDSLREELLRLSVSVAEIKMRPFDSSKVLDYLKQKFHEANDDPLLKVVSKLSGGSIAIANAISERIVDDIKFSKEPFTKDRLMDILSDSERGTEHWTSEWRRLKNESGPEMAELIPQPLLSYIGWI